jgi:small subunit ribosomal protein S6
MNSYETTLIFDPQLQDEGWSEAVARYSNIIAERQGEVKRTDLWGLRRLAYPIRKQTQGYYVQFVHESPADVPREIERRCLLDETCLRYLTVVGDNPRYLEELDKRQSARDAAAAASASRSDSDDESSDGGKDSSDDDRSRRKDGDKSGDDGDDDKNDESDED